MTGTTITQLGAVAIALAAIIGATVAVCLGHIDAPTYIAVLAGFGGVGVGIGAHAAGATTAQGSSGSAGSGAGQ